MAPNGSGSSQFWVILIVVALVVVRYLSRELRPRRINPRSTWAIPGIIVVFAGWMAWSAIQADAGMTVPLAIGCIVAIPVGAALGFAVSLFTRVISVVGEVAIVRGSYVTVAIWLAAFALRFLGRLAVASASFAEQFMLNAAFLVMLGAALTMVRLRVLAAARALPPPAPGTPTV